MLIGGVGLVATQANAQLKVGKNPTSIQKSAILELESDKQGLLLPRIADTTLMTPLNPPNGMIIYLTTTGKEGFYVRNNYQWERMAEKASSWDILGNALTNAATQFIGSTNNIPFVMRANNIEGMRIDNGNVIVKNDLTLSGVTAGANTLMDAIIVDGTGKVFKRTLTKAAFSDFMINGSKELNHLIKTNSPDYTFTDADIAGTSSTHTLSIATQNGAVGGPTVGLLTNADWNRFDKATKALQVAAFSTTANANGLTIDNTGANPTIALNAASDLMPGGVSIGTQSFGGDKTFTGKITGNNALAITAGGADITGNSKVTGTFNVTSTTKLDNTLTITTGGADITGATKVTGDVHVTGKSALDNTVTLGNVATGVALDSTVLLLNSANEVVSKKLPASIFTPMTFTQDHAGTDLKVTKDAATNLVTVSVPQADPSVIGGLVSNASQSFAGNKRFANDVAVKSKVIIGDTTNAANSTLQVAGSVSMAIKEIASAYTVDATDYTVIVKSTTAVTVSLPTAAGAKGRIYTIKKVAADATNNLNNTVTVKAAPVSSLKMVTPSISTMTGLSLPYNQTVQIPGTLLRNKVEQYLKRLRITVAVSPLFVLT